MQKYMVKNILRCALILLVGIAWSRLASADCTASATSYTIDIGTVVVQRDVPIGTAISNVLYGPENTAFSCTDPAGTGGGGAGFYSSRPLITSYGSNAVFSTNLTDIGYQLGSVGGFYSGQWNMWIGAGKTWQSQGSYSNNTGDTWTYTFKPQIQFVKTGQEMQGGVLNVIQVGYYQPRYNDVVRDPVIPINVSGNIQVLKCSISTPNLTFPIGDVSASKFGSSVGTVPTGAQITQNLGLNCEAGANINVALQGTQNPDVSTTSILALTGQGNADVAKGVGVQLLYNGAPLELNNRIVLKQSEGGQETFPITARYYQTQTSVSTGKANASATLDLTYQ